MVSKLSSEDVVKILDVHEEPEGLWNIRISDYNNEIKSDSAMFPPLFPPISSSLKTKIAALRQ